MVTSGFRRRKEKEKRDKCVSTGPDCGIFTELLMRTGLCRPNVLRVQQWGSLQTETDYAAPWHYLIMHCLRWESCYFQRWPAQVFSRNVSASVRKCVILAANTVDLSDSTFFSPLLAGRNHIMFQVQTKVFELVFFCGGVTENNYIMIIIKKFYRVLLSCGSAAGGLTIPLIAFLQFSFWHCFAFCQI